MNTNSLKPVRHWVLTLAIAAVMAIGATATALHMLEGQDTAPSSMLYVNHNSGSNGGG